MHTDTHTEVTELEKFQKLKYNIIASLLVSVFVVLSFGGSVFVLFLNQLGLDKSKIGVVLSITPFCQLIGLLAGPMVERIGFKRSFVTFYGIRTVAISLLLATPLVLSKWGGHTAYLWIGSVMFIFALCRAIGETALWPWTVELIPDSIRGKFSAVNQIIATIGIILTIAIAGFVIGRYEGLGKFIILIGAGLLAGFASLFFFNLLPGGSPSRSRMPFTQYLKDVKNVIRDGNFMYFMAGYGLVALAVGAAVSFVPLYMNEQVGIGQGKVVWLDMGTYTGMIIACYLWGWASDKFGAKPVIVTCLGVMVIIPVMWFLVPRNSSYSFRFAWAVSFLLGAFNIGWAVSFSKYLFSNAVPGRKKTPYMASFYAWAGLTAGFGPLIGGQILKLTNGFAREIWIFNLDSYSFLFGAAALGLFCSALIMSKIRPAGAIGTQAFLGMFLQGNPITAVSNVMRYHRGGNENERILRTENLGRTKTLINVDELIDALNDPSYNVRHEAIVAISKVSPDSKLIDALCAVLKDSQSDLSLSAAWALGRTGSMGAIKALRESLSSEYKLLRARSARSLAMLKDHESKGYLLEQMRNETDPALKVAYCSALGMLGAEEILDDVLMLLRDSSSETARRELTLTCARIIGLENRFIRHWRKISSDPATNTAQAVLTVRRELNEKQSKNLRIRRRIVDCAESFSRNELHKGSEGLCRLAQELGFADETGKVSKVIGHCESAISEFKADRLEYIVLMVHTIHTALRTGRK